MFQINDRVRITAPGYQERTATVVRTERNPKGEAQFYISGAGVLRGPWYADELELVFRLEDAQ